MGHAASRYINQQMVEQVGSGGQTLISDSHVLVVGLGGLGSIVSQYLAGAGIGTLSLCDSDRVDLSNLHRQIVHREDSIGEFKTTSCISRLREINSELTYHGIAGDITVTQFDTPTQIVDCTDNKETKLWLDTYAGSRGIPLVSAGVGVFQAHLYNIKGHQKTRLDQLIDKSVNPTKHITLGPVCGVVGSMQSLFVLYNCLGMQLDYNAVVVNTLSSTMQRMMLP